MLFTVFPSLIVELRDRVREFWQIVDERARRWWMMVIALVTPVESRGKIGRRRAQQVLDSENGDRYDRRYHQHYLDFYQYYRRYGLQSTHN